MEKIKFQSKPFDLAHAKAGAKVCCRDGVEANVSKWDRRVPKYVIGGYVGPNDAPAQWKACGRFSDSKFDNFDLVMPPLGYTDDGKPVWTGDMLLAPGQRAPHSVAPTHRTFVGCTWPAPAKVYPDSQIDWANYADAVRKAGSESISIGSAIAIANTAIRHAIDAGQVILPEDTKRADAAPCKAENALEALGWKLKDGEWYNAYSRHFYGEIGGIHMTGEKTHFKAVADLCAMRDAQPARDMAIAKAVERVFIDARYSIPGEDAIDLAAIIASVKP